MRPVALSGEVAATASGAPAITPTTITESAASAIARNEPAILRNDIDFHPR
jgi:hypothetical protein